MERERALEREIAAARENEESLQNISYADVLRELSAHFGSMPEDVTAVLDKARGAVGLRNGSFENGFFSLRYAQDGKYEIAVLQIGRNYFEIEAIPCRRPDGPEGKLRKYSYLRLKTDALQRPESIPPPSIPETDRDSNKPIAYAGEADDEDATEDPMDGSVRGTMKKAHGQVEGFFKMLRDEEDEEI